MQRIKSGKPRRQEKLFGAWEERGFFLRVRWGIRGILSPAPVQISALLCKSALALTISARESGARNLRCTGNNRLGGCPYSERFASQIEKAGRR